jgi:RimJ/RimL family protein N-acetyltransferase
MDDERFLQQVYDTSLGWAARGNTSEETALGCLIWNTRNPDHRESNCVWRFALSADLAASVAQIEARFASWGGRCYNWVPALGEAHHHRLLALGMRDHPSWALVRTTDVLAAPPPALSVRRATEDPEGFEAVFHLDGQRWRGQAPWKRALAALGLDDYTSYVLYWGDEVVGRVGLFCPDAPVARLKSLFVGSAHRGRGIGRAAIDLVAASAAARGYRWLTSEVEADNAASVACHEAARFRTVGRLHCYRRIAELAVTAL